ncbi:hypothetical protein M011DRAFT_321514 [Sporormia fimetaria CBS 119925]|uniref:Secreted protein n=1 Tax=Sporormia fimetaria CBS 119925 TaxID=1340428 RepID=A0A6A6VEJ9_9PLEO|nr:hypothetical protein M011DRAFT_321514 [Sporormia fimetaria CBS 119925]
MFLWNSIVIFVTSFGSLSAPGPYRIHSNCIHVSAPVFRTVVRYMIWVRRGYGNWRGCGWQGRGGSSSLYLLQTS